MWQRFTEQARRVIFYSQEEAAKFGENYVSTEHMLLGLIREPNSTAVKILDTMGVTRAQIRDEIELQITKGDRRSGQDMQLTPRAKRVIDIAYEEAKNLDDNFISTKHLLLALIREGEGVGSKVLQEFGVDLDRTRLEAMNLQDIETTTAGSPIPSEIPEMRNEARDILVEIIKEHGKSIHTDHKHCESLLWDRRGNYYREIMAFILVLHAGMIDELVASDHSSSRTEQKLALVNRLSREATQKTPIAKDCALWAMMSWAIVLGIL
jgi:ATP-dependent Clp protease ATP-binding subunit ClpA